MWILADVHAGADPDGDGALLGLLDRAVERRVDLLILGDLFAAWLGHPRFHTALQQAVMARLARLRGAGASVILVAGNRDYFVRPSHGFDRVIDEAVLAIGGVPTLVTHGDRANPDDRAYAAWRAVSRSTPVRLAAHALPAGLVRRLAERLEQRLATTNRAYKTGALPIPALEGLGRRAAQLGARRALIGHFHHDRTVDVAGGVPVIIAPAWLDHRRVLVVRGEALVSTPLDAL